MLTNNNSRRTFLRQTAVLSAATIISPGSISRPPVNKLPRWKGFNLLDFFSPDPTNSRKPTTEDYLQWMQDWGFDFVRIPIAYPWYLDFDRSRNITREEVYKIDEKQTGKIQNLVALAHKHNLHVSLNLHRAPGYCINAGFHEPYNLWKDEEALKAFCYHWAYWAKVYKNTSAAKISFDLVNEPSMREDMNDQHSKSGPVPGDLYRKVAKAASEAIRTENASHLVIADGNSVGNNVIPEITDLNIAQSCRGYYPGAISHFRAPWANKDPMAAPAPTWPLLSGSSKLDRQAIEKYYKPWIELSQQGVGVHCGECGCWNKTPHEVFLAWFGDVLDVLKQNQIGFALWEFSGDFGLINSGRNDVKYEDWHGQKLDGKLLKLLMRS
ncbi:MAG: glycosyl hydrolase family 5 [Chitinophagaceae bacterium]|nr:MAG: glycosyl hydrolase family 5 [Chitinophagaceae bacterium]